MRRLPVRWRLTAVFLVAMAAVLALVGTLVFAWTKHAIDDSIAQSLRARQGAARAYAEGGARPRLPPGERFAQVLSPAGRVLATRPAGQPPMLSPGEARVAAGGLRGFELHERTRYLAGPATVAGRRVVVVAAASLADHERALEGLGGALLIGGPIALLLAGTAAYLVAGAALRPVEAMRRRAAQISSADPDAQLPEPEVDDELRRLSVTLNAMLRRIAAAAEHERRFVANASHELRTPLAALRGELELAERHAPDADALRAAIGRSRGDVDRLVALTGGLLDLAAVEEGARHAADVDLAALLEAVRRDLAARTGGREVVVAPGAPSVTGDEEALRRAVTNLVENALVHGTGAVRVSACREDDRVVVAVEDDGVLHPSLADGRAFERFARGADAAGRPGSGLGLALVASVAEAHGGAAALGPRPGGGVRATLTLSASRARA